MRSASYQKINSNLMSVLQSNVSVDSFGPQSFFQLFTSLLADIISEQIVTGSHGDNNLSSKFFPKMTACAHPLELRGKEHGDDPNLLPGVI